MRRMTVLAAAGVIAVAVGAIYAYTSPQIE